MLTLTDNRNKQKSSKFEDLKVGTWYEDSLGNVCIKTQCYYNGENCLYVKDGFLLGAKEFADEPVKLLEVELLVSYSMEG